jgi:hypothetical protein
VTERTQGTMTETQQQHKRQRLILMGPARDSHRPDISRGSARAHVHAYFPVYAGLFRARFRAVGTIAPCAAPPKTGTGPHKTRITGTASITDITGLCPFMC